VVVSANIARVPIPLFTAFPLTSRQDGKTMFCPAWQNPAVRRLYYDDRECPTVSLKGLFAWDNQTGFEKTPVFD
jgi:hypothetical protein